MGWIRGAIARPVLKERSRHTTTAHGDYGKVKRNQDYVHSCTRRDTGKRVFDIVAVVFEVKRKLLTILLERPCVLGVLVPSVRLQLKHTLLTFPNRRTWPTG